MTNTQTKENFGEQQAQAQLNSIKEMVTALDAVTDSTPDNDREAIEQRIQETPLSVEVRQDWHRPGDQDFAKSSEYKILLCTGGPAVQIVGELDRFGQPDNARLQYQDWFTPWNDFSVSGADADALLTFTTQFYFGE